MTDEILLTLASDIVCAHVSNNDVTPEQLPELIKSVHQSLAKLGEPAAEVEEKREPAVSVRASIKPDILTCLECGAKMKMLKRHLSTDHGLSPAEYRARWNLASDYPMVAPQYAAKRKELAVKIGLGRKPKAPFEGGAVQTKAAAPKKSKIAQANGGEGSATRRGKTTKAPVVERESGEA